MSSRQEITSTLKSINSLIEIDAIIDHIDRKKETHSTEVEIDPELSKKTIDLNNEMQIIPNDGLNISSDSNKEIRGSTNEIISKGESNNIMKYENRMTPSESPSNASTSEQVNQVTKTSYDFIEFLNLDKIIAYVIEKHDKGATFDQAQQLISKSEG
ncbi:1250_t:CDS:2 [Rhizophagus irregularis]|nr:1250_t:CDS:2 [Rhizophagus irregularis]